VSDHFPRLIAYCEAKTNLDLSRTGRCRLDNAQAILRAGEGTLAGGYVEMANGKRYGHLWGVDKNGKIVDTVCPVSRKECQIRRAVAIYDPFRPGAPVLAEDVRTAQDQSWVNWGHAYLGEYIAAL
jgi:hypothetical protein